MTEQQKVILKIMKWFHEFCETHKLRYYIIGGTLIGAVRHQGFIPWDDDADVAMPREDYEKFLVLTENIEFPYQIESPKNCRPDYQWPFAKIFDPQTTLVEETNRLCVRGVWVDVFPIDGTLSGVHRIAKYITTRSFIRLLRLKNIRQNNRRKYWKRLVLAVSQPVLNCISTNWLIKLIDRLSCEPDFSKSEYISDVVWGSGWICHTPKYFWEKPQLFKFEDAYFWGLSEYDKYLSKLYGDYRRLPPAEKRVKHSSLYVDLNNSWDSIVTKENIENMSK